LQNLSFTEGHFEFPLGEVQADVIAEPAYVWLLTSPNHKQGKGAKKRHGNNQP